MTTQFSRPLTAGSVLQARTPEGAVLDLVVDHLNGNYAWAGSHRLHILDDRVHTPEGERLQWRSHDGIVYTLMPAPPVSNS